MNKDLRYYGFNENTQVISQAEQLGRMLSGKVGPSDGDGSISQTIKESTNKIVGAIEGSNCGCCKTVTKEDLCKAKSNIINAIEGNKRDIIKEIDDKLVDLNKIVK